MSMFAFPPVIANACICSFFQLLHKLCKARIIYLTFWALCLEIDYFISVSSTYMLHFISYKLDVVLQMYKQHILDLKCPREQIEMSLQFYTDTCPVVPDWAQEVHG